VQNDGFLKQQKRKLYVLVICSIFALCADNLMFVLGDQVSDNKDGHLFIYF